MMATPSFPFTAAWLETALGARAGSLHSFDAAPVGTGQVADSHRLTLRWNGAGGPASLIAKTPSHARESRESAVAWKLYVREVNWYRHLAARSTVRCPALHYAEIDQQGGNFVLILEDCAPARQGDQLTGAMAAEIDAALAQAAGLHAGFMNDPSLPALPWLDIDRALRTPQIDLFAASWPLFRDRYRGRLDAAILALGDALARVFPRYAQWEPANFTVTHNDFRIDNVLFGAADGRPVILDWQTIGIGHPMRDVAYLIGTSFADAATRQAHERRLVGDYHAALASQGAELPWDDVWSAYRRYALSGFVMAVFSSMLVGRTERGDEMFAKMAERPALQALHLESLAVV